MTFRHSSGRFAVAIGLAAVTSAWLLAQTGVRVDVPKADQDAVSDFEKALGQYDQMRKRVEGSVRPVPKDATPQQIDQNQRQLATAYASARAMAKPGDVFTPTFQAYARRKLDEVFKRPDGKIVRSSILDENPIGTPVRINGPYPDAIPLTTMPPQVLEALPKLPKDLEYRFVGDRLILFDNHAHLIVDYIDRALPRV